MSALVASVAAALVSVGVPPERAAEHAASSNFEGTWHMQWLLSDITKNPEWYRPTVTAVKACACGRAHDARGFDALPAPTAGGTMDDGEGGRLTLRNCPCGSTLAVQTAQEIT